MFSAAGGVVRTFGRQGNGAGQLNRTCGVSVDGAATFTSLTQATTVFVVFSAEGDVSCG
jgi:hypothetical protein